MLLGAMVSYAHAEELLAVKCGWELEDCHQGQSHGEGWVLRAKKKTTTADLHFHARRIQKIAETEHFLFFRDVGVAHSSSYLFCVRLSEHCPPRVVYQSPEPDLASECDAELLHVQESNGLLSFCIRVFDKRCRDNRMTLKMQLEID